MPKKFDGRRYVIAYNEKGVVKTYDRDNNKVVSSIDLGNKARAIKWAREKTEQLRKHGARVTMQQVPSGKHESRRESYEGG